MAGETTPVWHRPRHKVVPVPPMFLVLGANRKRRRIPPTGQPATTAIIPRIKIHAKKIWPIPKLATKRHKLPPTGLPPIFTPPRMRGTRPIKRLQAHVLMRSKRHKLPPTGAETIRLIRRKHTGRVPAMGPLPSRGRRRRVPNLGITIIAGPVFRRKRLRSLALPVVARTRRHKLPPTGLALVLVMPRRRPKADRRLMALRPKTRRRVVFNTGLTFIAGALLKMRRRLNTSAWQLVGQRPRKRRRNVFLTLVGNIVPGPYSIAAGQIYCAGAVAGDVRSQ